METMRNELLDKIEKCLGITFHEWQRKYILGEPMVLDMQEVTGRCSGKTLAYIIKQLFETPKPLPLRDVEEVIKASDWWSCGVEMKRELSYAGIYRDKIIDTCEKLNEGGIITRPVIVNKTCKASEYCQKCNADKERMPKQIMYIKF